MNNYISFSNDNAMCRETYKFYKRINCILDFHLFSESINITK